jgi:hypothetical protein
VFILKELSSQRVRAHNSIAAATAATATASATGESARWLGRSAVARSIRCAENRKLQGILLPRAFRAGNLLRLIQHNLLEVRLAILTNVFINRHLYVPRSLNVHYIRLICLVRPSCRPESSQNRSQVQSMPQVFVSLFARLLQAIAGPAKSESQVPRMISI